VYEGISTLACRPAFRSNGIEPAASSCDRLPGIVTSLTIAPSGGPRWNEYRRRRGWFYAALVACPLTILALGMIVPGLVASDAPVTVLIFAGMTAIGITSARMAYFRCPRCGKLFFRKGWMRNSFAQSCMHCGLPKWAEADTSNSGAG
jgi:predicted RNA-binding Zn-ribbon protein involved in translation (DUF1610 family)